MKELAAQKIEAIVISESDNEDNTAGLRYPGPNVAKTSAPGNPNVIIISDSEDENEIGTDSDVVMAPANTYEIVAKKMAGAYVVFSGRTLGVFTEW